MIFRLQSTGELFAKTAFLYWSGWFLEWGMPHRSKRILQRARSSKEHLISGISGRQTWPWDCYRSDRATCVPVSNGAIGNYKTQPTKRTCFKKNTHNTCTLPACVSDSLWYLCTLANPQESRSLDQPLCRSWSNASWVGIIPLNSWEAMMITTFEHLWTMLVVVPIHIGYPSLFVWVSTF